MCGIWAWMVGVSRKRLEEGLALLPGLLAQMKENSWP